MTKNRLYFRKSICLLFLIKILLKECNFMAELVTVTELVLNNVNPDMQPICG